MNLKWKQLMTKLAILLVMAFTGVASQLANGAEIESHVHGISALAIVMEGNALEVQLHSPAINLLSFEHKANSAQEIAAVEKVVKKLKRAGSFVSINGGQCKMVKQSIDVSSVLTKSHNDHESDHHSHHDTHAHKEAHEQHSNHSEIIADYTYRCKSIGTLSSMAVSLFEAFPGIHEIQVIWIKETLQGAATLNTDNKEIIFR